METKPTLIIPYQVSAILDYLAKTNADEWQCFCPIKELIGNKFTIENKFVFPKQENSGAATVTTPEEFSEILPAMDDWENFIWIHSHNSMPAFWSGTDHTQMKLDAQESGRHTFSLVVNNKGDKKASLNMFRPMKGLFDMDIEIDFPLIEASILTAHQEVLDSVQRKKKAYVYTKYNGRQSSFAHGTFGKDSAYNRAGGAKQVAVKEATERASDTVHDYYPAPNKKTRKILKKALDNEFFLQGYTMGENDYDDLFKHYRYYFNKKVDEITKYVKLYVEQTYEV